MRNYCIRSDVTIDHAQYQGWNIGVEHWGGTSKYIPPLRTNLIGPFHAPM